VVEVVMVVVIHHGGGGVSGIIMVVAVVVGISKELNKQMAVGTYLICHCSFPCHPYLLLPFLLWLHHCIVVGGGL